MSKVMAPDGSHHHDATAVLTVDDVEKALAFYEKAFGARVILRAPGADGTAVGHGQIRIGDTILFIASVPAGIRDTYLPPSELKGTSCAVYLYVEDCDAQFRRAVAAGATALKEPADQFWGDRDGLIRDPAGHLWVLATRR